jgi:PKD repeat protein
MAQLNHEPGSPSHQHRLLPFALVALLVVPGSLLTGATAAITTGTNASYIPATLAGSSFAPGLAWTGNEAYILGGANPPVSSLAFDRILKFTPGDNGGTIATMPTVLPTPTAFGSAVWVGTRAYLFGGWSTSGLLDTIVRYDPVEGTASTLSAVLPLPLDVSTAVWDGEAVYILGGRTSGGLPGALRASDLIFRFDPVTETITTLPTRLPEPRAGGYAVVAGEAIFYVGGSILNQLSSDSILRFDPATGAITQAGKLPSTWSMGGVVWDGSRVYVLGGGQSTANVISPNFQVYQFNPATGNVVLLSDSLPYPGSNFGHLFSGATFTDGCSAYGIGTGPNADRIVKYGICPEDRIIDEPPQALFSGGAMAIDCDGRTIHFDARASMDAEGPIASYAWDFGDRQGGAGPTPIHVFAEGTWRVRLTVTDSAGQSASSEMALTIPVACGELGTSVPVQPEWKRGGTVPDSDMDGVADSADNCVSYPNRDQGDADRDGAGDACDDAPACLGCSFAFTSGPGGPFGDHDLDGVPDGGDNCPSAPNLDQADLDADLVGDACDGDRDGDGVADLLDGCPAVPDPRQDCAVQAATLADAGRPTAAAAAFVVPPHARNSVVAWSSSFLVIALAAAIALRQATARSRAADEAAAET